MIRFALFFLQATVEILTDLYKKFRSFMLHKVLIQRFPLWENYSWIANNSSTLQYQTSLFMVCERQYISDAVCATQHLDKRDQVTALSKGLKRRLFHLLRWRNFYRHTTLNLLWNEGSKCWFSEVTGKMGFLVAGIAAPHSACNTYLEH